MSDENIVPQTGGEGAEQHGPEPWQVMQSLSSWVNDGEGQTLYDANGDPTVTTDYLGHGLPKSAVNIARVRACVNACKDVPNAVLESLNVAELLKAVHDLHNELTEIKSVFVQFGEETNWKKSFYTAQTMRRMNESFIHVNDALAKYKSFASTGKGSEAQPSPLSLPAGPPFELAQWEQGAGQ